MELGNTEIRAEAMAWRVPALVALCDLESARHEVAALRGDREQTAQPFMIHVDRALRLGDRALRGTAGGGRGGGVALRRVGPAADRTGFVRRVRVPDVQRPPRAGPAGRARAGDQAARRRPRPRRPVAPRARRPARRAGDGGRGAARARAVDAGRARPLPRVALARIAHLSRPTPARPSATEAAAALLYPELEPFAGGERDDRAPRRVLRGGRPLPRHARVDARRRRSAPSGTSSAPWRSNRRMGAATWLAHTDYEYARMLLVHRAGERDLAAALLGEAAEIAEGIGMPVLLGRVRALGSPAPSMRLPDGLSPREVQVLGLVAPGSATGRSAARCPSASTRPPTTCAASCARPAARTAPKLQATPTVTGSPLTDQDTIGGSCRST